MAAFLSLKENLLSAIKKTASKGKLSIADIDEVIRDIRKALLKSDVDIDIVKNFCANMRQKALEADILNSLSPSQQIIKIVFDELVKLLGGETRLINLKTNGLTVIMLVGLQGSGKTTFAAKLANLYKQDGKKVVIAALDLIRPNAVTQLKTLGALSDIDIYAPFKGNVSENPNAATESPVKASKMALKHALDNKYDILICDTAGRLEIDEAMLEEASDIKKAINPDEVIFIIDSMVGQKGTDIALSFNNSVGFTGAALTKLDGDSKGGVALSISSLINKPIYYSSDGEKIEDIEIFHPDRHASRILDMGDTLTLIEKAQKAYSLEEAKKLEEKLLSETFGLDDFKKQLQQIKKMGNLTKLIGFIPAAGQLKSALNNFDISQLTSIEAIIDSMTYKERKNPKSISAARKEKIAYGSGTSISVINRLLKQFESMQKMFKSVGKGGLKNISANDLLGANTQAFGAQGALPYISSGTPYINRSKSKRKQINKKKNKKGGNPANKLGDF